MDIKHTRIIGTIAAFDTHNYSTAQKLEVECLEHGLLIRPLGNEMELQFHLVPASKRTQ